MNPLRASTDTAKAVIKAAHALAKARTKIGANGLAVDSVWDEIERRENLLLRAVERMAGLKRLTFDEKDSR